MNAEQAQDVARIAKVLSHSTRVLAVAILAKGPTTAGALWRELNVIEPIMSRHLTLFRMTGLVQRVRKGREMHYSLNREKLAAIRQFAALFEHPGEETSYDQR